MPNAFQDDSQSHDIGILLLQADRWERIMDQVKAGFSIRGIAASLLESDNEIRSYYEHSESKNPLKTLSNVISYHVNEKMPIAERYGHAMFRNYFEQETDGMNILRELKQLIVLQKERTGQAISFERKIGLSSPQAGREMVNLAKMYAILGQLLIAAGLVSYLQEEATKEKEQHVASSERRGRLERALEIYVMNNPGMTKKVAIEQLTGITDITHGAEQVLSH